MMKSETRECDTDQPDDFFGRFSPIAVKISRSRPIRKAATFCMPPSLSPPQLPLHALRPLSDPERAKLDRLAQHHGMNPAYLRTIVFEAGTAHFPITDGGTAPVPAGITEAVQMLCSHEAVRHPLGIPTMHQEKQSSPPLVLAWTEGAPVSGTENAPPPPSFLLMQRVAVEADPKNRSTAPLVVGRCDAQGKLHGDEHALAWAVTGAGGSLLYGERWQHGQPGAQEGWPIRVGQKFPGNPKAAWVEGYPAPHPGQPATLPLKLENGRPFSPAFLPATLGFQYTPSNHLALAWLEQRNWLRSTFPPPNNAQQQFVYAPGAPKPAFASCAASFDPRARARIQSLVQDWPLEPAARTHAFGVGRSRFF